MGLNNMGFGMAVSVTTKGDAALMKIAGGLDKIDKNGVQVTDRFQRLQTVMQGFQQVQMLGNQVASAGQMSKVAIHAEDTLGDDADAPSLCGAFEQLG